MAFSHDANQTTFPFILPNLPYAKDALVPHLTPETIDFHYGKHHNAYVVNLNNLLENHILKNKSLEEIVIASIGKADIAGIFNNASQIWNHTFYWHSMKADGGGKPSDKLLARMESDFGSFDDFVTQFKQAGTTQFGSGWAWLVEDNGKLKIVKTSNAGVPFTDGLKPLITCDVWEHAYYIDFRNRRQDYISVFLDYLVNWDFVEKNLG